MLSRHLQSLNSERIDNAILREQYNNKEREYMNCLEQNKAIEEQNQKWMKDVKSYVDKFSNFCLKLSLTIFNICFEFIKLLNLVLKLKKAQNKNYQSNLSNKVRLNDELHTKEEEKILLKTQKEKFYGEKLLLEEQVIKNVALYRSLAEDYEELRIRMLKKQQKQEEILKENWKLKSEKEGLERDLSKVSFCLEIIH